MRRSIISLSAAFLGPVAVPFTAGAQLCEPHWADMGPTPYHFSESFFTVFDDGGGPTLYRGDNLERILIRWGPDGWRPFSMTGVPAGFEPYAPVALNWGVESRLYLTGPVAGQYRLLRWLGNHWEDSGVCIGNSCPGYDALGGHLMAVDLGGGPKLYAYGYRPFNADTFVLRWDDTQWTEIGAATNTNVSALVPYDDGTGLALYAIGNFRMFSGIAAEGMVKWDGQTWTAATPSANRVVGRAEALVADLGDGPAIYTTSSVRIDGLARLWLNKWDGHQWTHPGHPDSGYVRALAVFDDGRGPALYIGGNFGSYAGVPARNIVRYTPAGGFEPLGAGTVGEVSRLFPFLDQRGPALYIGSDELVGAGGGVLRQTGVLWVGCPNCYANCDLSTSPSTLNVNDFVCFMQKFIARDPYANCDNSTASPAINVNDFVCFAQKFGAGCP